MSLETDFEIFIGNLEPTNISEMEITVGEIAKKLNKNYYNWLCFNKLLIFD